MPTMAMAAMVMVRAAAAAAAGKRRVSLAALLLLVLAALCFLMRLAILDGPRLLRISRDQQQQQQLLLRRYPYQHDPSPAAADAPAPSPAAAAAAGSASPSSSAAAAAEVEWMERAMPAAAVPMVAVWRHLAAAMARTDSMPETWRSVHDAAAAWSALLLLLQQDQEQQQQQEGQLVQQQQQCPDSVSRVGVNADLNKGAVNGGQGGGGVVAVALPCGLVVDSSVTIMGVPRGEGGGFRVELVGVSPPGGEPPPILFHHNPRLRGDKLSPGSPVIVQNSWTAAGDWADEERCPLPQKQQQQQQRSPANQSSGVDGLAWCSAQVSGGSGGGGGAEEHWWPAKRRRHKWFPYSEGQPFAATLWAGWDGFHVTVDGKHVTSFAYRQNLEPWMVSQVSIDGSLLLNSIMVTGLPTSEPLDTLPDLEALRAPPLPNSNSSSSSRSEDASSSSFSVEMLVGVVSNANNFERRMAVRRSWMQYPSVRSAKVAVRFFVGLHHTQQVNRELWREAAAYGDIQLLPFVDYYNLITFKSLAVCIFAAKVANARLVMKTDDDTFVRIDEVLLQAVRAANASKQQPNQQQQPLLYGLIEFEARPDRDSRSKWFVTEQEWPEPLYPPWAHGPGYIISRDIADYVVAMNEQSRLKLFKLEDVAMGAWIEDYRRHNNVSVNYVNDARFYSDGCHAGYRIAHYQNPRQMLCLWQRLQQQQGAGAAAATCC